MKKLFTIICLLTAWAGSTSAQCTLQTVVSDGFEYTTTCPNLVPNTVWHYTPQSFAVHTGATSLYLNFIDCNGGAGTCAGEKVYERGFTVCKNEPIQFSLWLATSFAGTQSNVKVDIKDGNGTILNQQLTFVAPYAPIWGQYQSGIVFPITDSVVFIMYTNVGGSPGNDLSIDDFLMEKCVGGNYGNGTTSGSICDNAPVSNLYPLLGINDTTGTWSGPTVLTGGYHGTFQQGVNTLGAYVYENHYFGFGAGCPLAYDTLDVTTIAPPVINLGNDTSMCLNQSMLLNAGSAPGNTYLWNNGVTGPNVLAFTTSQVPVTNTYSVIVTSSAGCINNDTLLVDFVICSGIDDEANMNTFNVYPNPANAEVHVKSNFKSNTTFAIYNTIGEIITTGVFTNGENVIKLPASDAGLYWLQLTDEKGATHTEKLIIRN